MMFSGRKKERVRARSFLRPPPPNFQAPDTQATDVSSRNLYFKPKLNPF